MRISQGAKDMNIEILDVPGSEYHVKDVWTTRDGEWYTSGKEFSIPQWAIDEYHTPGELGGATNMFVTVLNEDGFIDYTKVIEYKNTTVYDKREIQERDGFANIPVFNSFRPDLGQNGGWQTGIEGVGYGTKGGGLPYNYHVSLFVVYQKGEFRPIGLLRMFQDGLQSFKPELVPARVREIRQSHYPPLQFATHKFQSEPLGQSDLIVSVPAVTE